MIMRHQAMNMIFIRFSAYYLTTNRGAWQPAPAIFRSSAAGVGRFSRTFYHITDAGRQYLKAWLQKPEYRNDLHMGPH